MNTKKVLYHGIFNYAQESYELYTHATSRDFAFLNFCSQISKSVGVNRTSVLYYFDGSKDNYFIERR